jgi:4-amino-4-deoxy-L-arabinose transferase-like glycosyltransferase
VTRLISSHRTRWLLLGILLCEFFLRAFEFQNNPPGFYVDEAGVGYEAYSLPKTGADRWGIHLPVYFISWGSGQSVLYSYLTTPIIAVLGLSIFSTRLLSLAVGALTLPLLYATVKRAHGETAALLSTLLLAVMPWHVMISRWALDANLLPFFLLLGTYTVSRALERRSAASVIVALLPWGLALYAYAMAFIVVPILVVLVFTFYHKSILGNRSWWGALALFGLLAFPIALFLAKNFVFQRALAVESFLPFGIPLLPISRFAQVASPLTNRLNNNLLFVISGFQDGEIRNAVLGVAPTFIVLFPLAFVSVVSLGRELKSSGKADLFWLWLFACLPLFFPTDLAINRINAIFIPMLVVAVVGLLRLYGALPRTRARRILQLGVAALIVVQAGVFAVDYFFVYPSQPDTELAFFKGFDRALNKGLTIAGASDNILVTNRIALPYFLTAFISTYPPDRYPREIKYTIEQGAVNVQSLGRFYFGMENLPNPNASFTYVLAKWDDAPCANVESFLETRLWKVGRCTDTHISADHP